MGGEGRESRHGEIDKEGTVGRRDPEGAVRTNKEGEGKEEKINSGKEYARWWWLWCGLVMEELKERVI